MRQRGAAGPLSRGYAWGIIFLHPLIPLLWIAAAVWMTMTLPGLGTGANAALEDVVAKDSTALATQARAAEVFGAPLATDISVVLRNPDGLTHAEAESVLDGAQAVREGELGPDLEGLRGAVPLVNVPIPTLDWGERNTTAVTYLGFDPSLSLIRRRDLAERYAERYLKPVEGSRVSMSGASPARLAQFAVIEDALPVVTIATVLLVGLIVGLHFRSIVAPFVTLAAAGVAYAVAIRVLGFSGAAAGISVPREVEPVLVVLLLGLVTDYAVFFLSAMRSSLVTGLDKRQATLQATIRTARIVLTAGLIVAAGTGALIAGRLEFFRAFGPGLALTALVSLVVCITFIPATMALFGRRLFGRLPEPSSARTGAMTETIPARPSDRLPRRMRSRVAMLGTAMRVTGRLAEQEGQSRGRVMTARILASRPVAFVVVLVTIVALLFVSAPAQRLDLGLSFISGLPADDRVRVGAEDAGRAFAPGILSPTEVILEHPGMGKDPAPAIEFQRLIERLPGVAASVGPREDVPLELDLMVAPGADAVRMALVLDEEPDSAAAIEHLEGIRKSIPAIAREAGMDPQTRVLIGGETLLAAETVAAVIADLGRIALAALAVNFILLAIFMRALVAPFYLLAASVLAFAASLGVTVWLLDYVGLGGGVAYFVPLATAVLLVSLGSDYNVFVAGRIWEEARRRRLREAVAVAAPKAAGAITVAGITLAASFALLALIPLESFREFALLMVVGVLLDAIVVRSVLIPGLVSLFGETSWWPGRRVRPAGYEDFMTAVRRRVDMLPQHVRPVTEATLVTLCQRIERGEAVVLQRQLPKELQDTMERPRGAPEQFDSGEFVRRVSDKTKLSQVTARQASVAVIGALREVVDETTMTYVRAQLSPDYSVLLSPTAPEPGRLAPVEV
ncbi:MAG: MMPL family transporter [Actinomycetota bacterium]|nr:MMPL family transporter [Actinomycetota bacterium]